MQVFMWDECLYEQQDTSTYKPSTEGFRGLAIALVLSCIELMAIATRKEMAAAPPYFEAELLCYFVRRAPKFIT